MQSLQVKVFLIFSLVCCFLLQTNGQSNNNFPRTVLKNKHLKISIYLPDTISGYYRSARFDWSGIISSLKYRNHEYFGEWFEKHDPFVHDAITGPVEEFSPIGYDDAKVGDAFMKIGVGFLEKPNESQYRFSTKYKIIDHGIWKVDRKKGSVVFTQSLKGNGYGYEYRKVLSIKPGNPEMVLKHSIKNTGVKSFSATVYNHNMFTIDNTGTGKNFVIQFPFKLKLISKNNDSDSLLELNENIIRYKRDLIDGEKLKIDLAGFKSSYKDYSINIRNTLTKVGVKITGNRPMHQLAYWSIPTVLSPEPYIIFTIAPNEEFSWDIHYLFYQIKS